MYAEVIGNGSLAPTGTATFSNSETPLGSSAVDSYTNTNLLLYSSQFDSQPWFAEDDNSVLTANYTASPLGDQTAYRYQNVSMEYGTAIYQWIEGLPGNQPVTFSVWVKSNNGQVQDLFIAATQDGVPFNGAVNMPCYATPAWKRCSVTIPSHANDVAVSIGSDSTQWGWDVSIWGAQAELGSLAGPYVATTTAPVTATMGFAAYTTSDLPEGNNTLAAAYSGDGNYLQSGYTNYPGRTTSLQIVAYCLLPQMNPECGVITLPNVIPGTQYPATALGAVGGTPPYTWQVTEGQMPAGLNLSSDGIVTGSPTGAGNSSGVFGVTVTDSGNPPRTVEHAYEIDLTGFSSCPTNSRRVPLIYKGGLFSVYPNVVAAGAANQSVTLYVCLVADRGNYGALTLILPDRVTQVAGLTVGGAPLGNGQSVQGYVNIASNASVGTGNNPPQIGLKQILDGIEYDYTLIQPYYITQYCPTSISLTSTSEKAMVLLGSPLWTQGNRTGIGEYVAMQANPLSTNWDQTNTGSFIWESLYKDGSSCQTQTGESVDFCNYNWLSPGYVYDQIRLRSNGSPTPKMYDTLWDQHYWVDMPNDLLQWNLGTCAAACRQWYYCGNTVEGNFTIEYDLTRKSFAGTAYTYVDATKQ